MSEYLDPIAGLLGEWSRGITAGSILLRVCLALLVSSLIGCERATKRHAAGLRTFIVVCLTSTVSAILDAIAFSLPFLSAGCLIGVAVMSVNTVLFSSKNQIKGLTTSVGLWACSALGVAIGFGYYFVGLLFCLIFVCSLTFFPKFEGYLKDRSNHFELQLELNDAHYLQPFTATIRELGLIIDDIEINSAYYNSGLSVYSISITIRNDELKKYKTHGEIIAALKTLDYVHHIEKMK